MPSYFSFAVSLAFLHTGLVPRYRSNTASQSLGLCTVATSAPSAVVVRLPLLERENTMLVPFLMHPLLVAPASYSQHCCLHTDTHSPPFVHEGSSLVRATFRTAYALSLAALIGPSTVIHSCSDICSETLLLTTFIELSTTAAARYTYSKEHHLLEASPG